MIENSKKVLVSGATGQTGSYMIEYLLENTQNTIIAAIRRTSQSILSNLANVLDNPRVKLVTMDLCDGHSIEKVISEEKPDYFINLGGATFVQDSWTTPALHMQVNAISLIHILEAIKKHCPKCRLYSAGSSEQLGDVKYVPQDENHPLTPKSIYAVSKCSASMICKVYRESYGMYAVHGILFNHESPRRQEYFVTRKITKGIARILKSIKNGESFEPIKLGSLDSKRDWSHAKDFCSGIWKMLNQEIYMTDKYGDSPSQFIKSYVLASGETHTIREFIEMALKLAKIEGYWQGEGVNEKFYLSDYILESINCKSSVIIEVSKEFFRPNDVPLLLGNAEAAKKDLGWKPEISFDKLVEEMLLSDIDGQKEVSDAKS